MRREKIVAHCEKSYKEVIRWIENQEVRLFDMGPQGKWTTAQVLDHLIQSNRLLQKALTMPHILLKHKFGRPNRPVRSYDEVVERYRERLENADPDVERPTTPVRDYQASDKEVLIEHFRKTCQDLIATIRRWDESKLDKFLLPHPLMGKMIIREMLMWCSHHHYHHLNILKEKYAKI